MLMTRLICLKNLSTWQLEPPNTASGSLQLLGLGRFRPTSSGISSRVKCHTLMCWLSHSMAYTPPPAALNPSPYDDELLPEGVKPQPMFWVPTAQSALRCDPEYMPSMDGLCEHPSAVCAEMMFLCAVLTPSMMSTSPPAGQSVPYVQTISAFVRDDGPLLIGRNGGSR